MDWASGFSLHPSGVTSGNVVVLRIQFILQPTCWWKRTDPGLLLWIKERSQNRVRSTGHVGSVGQNSHLFWNTLPGDTTSYRRALLKLCVSRPSISVPQPSHLIPSNVDCCSWVSENLATLTIFYPLSYLWLRAKTYKACQCIMEKKTDYILMLEITQKSISV